MRLEEQGLADAYLWEQKGYGLPQFDRACVRQKTKERPCWIHFGAGNIFRAFHANIAQRLLAEGWMDRGIIVAEGFDYEIVEKVYRPHDDYSLLVTLKADGSVEKTVVGSVVESCLLDAEREEEFSRLREIFSADSLQLATFTITEKGYSLVDGRGEMFAAVQSDLETGPDRPQSYPGKVAALLYTRYLKGGKPIAMVSTDNCAHNGDRLREAVKTFAEGWETRGLAETGFAAYIDDPGRVSFPWSMIDKITPRPDEAVERLLREDGLEAPEPIVTEKKSYVAPFVNAEESEYLVIEDAFPNGRPPLERAGVLFADRETVEKVERMKVCTCLNPLHTALAVFGCLLGFDKISEEMRDPDLCRLAERIGRCEGMPVVTDPGILNPEEFLETVLRVRLPNPFMPDTPQRIATDTSQKLAIRFGETIRRYWEREKAAQGGGGTGEGSDSEKGLDSLRMIPLVLAGWLRYLMAVDDEGKSFELSPDPLLESLRPCVKDMRLGECIDGAHDCIGAGEEPVTCADGTADAGSVLQAMRNLLESEQIFGVNLYEVGLAGRVWGYFREMTVGRGAVRATLHRHVSGEE